jgi:hypothetical protein
LAFALDRFGRIAKGHGQQRVTARCGEPEVLHRPSAWRAGGMHGSSGMSSSFGADRAWDELRREVRRSAANVARHRWLGYVIQMQHEGVAGLCTTLVGRCKCKGLDAGL